MGLSSLPACAAGSGRPGVRPGHGAGGQRAPGHPPCCAQRRARIATADLGPSFGVALHTARTSLERVKERSHGTRGCAGHHRSEGPPPGRAASPTTPTRAIPKAPEPRGSLLGARVGPCGRRLPSGLLRGSAPAGGPADRQHQTLRRGPARGRRYALGTGLQPGRPALPAGTHAASSPLPRLISSTPACFSRACRNGSADTLLHEP